MTAQGKGGWTPGPWGFGNTAQHDRLILGGGGTGGYVCHVTVEQCGGGIVAQSMEPEREANTRLIAAAPQLVKALEHYTCSCEPGRCAVSLEDDDTPADEMLCGRIAANALRLAREEPNV